MDYNDNEETTPNVVNTTVLGTWHGDTRSCEQGQIIYQCPTLNCPININEIDKMADNQPITVKDTAKQNHQPIMSTETDNQPIDSSETNQSNNSPEKHNQPIRFSFANSQTIRSSLSSSSDSSDSSKTTTWGQVKLGSPTKSKKDSKCQKSSKSPNQSPTKNKNENRNMTSWKDISPTKSSSSSDLEHSNHSNQSNEYATNRIFRFSSRMKDFTESSSSSDLDPGNPGQQPNEYANKDNSVTNQIQESNCNCKNASNGGSPCKRSCNCLKNCISHIPDNQNVLTNSNTSLNENGSPKREKALTNSPDELCDNDYYYEDDFTVQFDTNLRETSVTPIDSDPNTTILDFPNMVTGSYLCFNNGGSSNVSFNNLKASSNLSVNNMRGSNIIQNLDERVQYDSEFSGNSGSRNSTMEMSSSERDMMGSSDMIDFSDGPLFTPTPSHILSTDSLDKNPPEPIDPEMSGSNGSGETNLNVDCCTKKEEYYLSFDGSNSRVSGSDTDISLSFTSHDSCQGHWSSHDSVPQTGAQAYERNGGTSSMEGGQDETSDSFHICFNKLSPQHKKHQYMARDNLAGRVLKLVPLKETMAESGDSSEDENTRTSTTLTAGTGTGSKDMSTLSAQGSPKKKVIKPQLDILTKVKGDISKKKIQKSENLFLVGIGKPIDILRKAGVHSHTMPNMKNLVSWKQVKGAKAIRKGESCTSLPELSSSTTWQNISGLKCRKLSEVSESFHSKRHSASLLEFYQRLKSQSNPVSPETMNNLEQMFMPNFIGQKIKQAELSDSSNSSQECVHCQCHRQPQAISGSVTKAYTNKRIFDWLKMECSSSSRESNRPNSLACQTGNAYECSTKETIISPQTITLWCGTKTVASQFPPVTKESCSQTFTDNHGTCVKLGLAAVGKKDQSLQTSDFEEEEILSILSDNFDEFNFLRSNEGIAKDLLSCPENLFTEKDSSHKIHRSKSVDEYRQQDTNRSYQERQSRSDNIGRSKSTGRLGHKSESMMRRMGISHHYSHQSLPDIAFLTSSITLEKGESKESLFDPLKLDLPVPVTVAPKTELEQFNIYQQTTLPCQHSCHHEKHSNCCDSDNKGQKGQTESGSSSSGVFTSSTSSGADTGFCECRSRSATSPQNDLERLIFFPPHTELSRKAKLCCGPKKRAHSLPNKLSDCANGTDVRLDKYANEVHPQAGPGSKSAIQGQGRKRINTAKNKTQLDTENGENLYSLEEEQTPVASPERPCCHDKNFNGNCCEGDDERMTTTNGNKCNCFAGERDFTDSDFYREVSKDNIIIVNDVCYRGISMDSTSSSGSSVPNGERKPLKSCLRKRNRALRSRSLSAADNLNLNFDDMDEKIKNRHSYACDEVYIVSDEHGQLMMYQADDSAEPVMFYLGKDGECHMTEGTKAQLENNGSIPNFDIQAVDSINGSDSSTEREASGKRKSVSFASEVSFQSISPALSPKKQVTASEGVEVGNVAVDKNEGQELPTKLPSEEKKGDCGEQTTDEATETETTSIAVEVTEPHVSEVTQGGGQDDQGSNSSSDTPPEEFHVTMDTNDNLWSEDVMLEKINLLMAVSKASDYLTAHFAKSVDTFDKLRLGNTSETPEIGDIVMTKLCPALTVVIGNRLKHHLTGFQMFGRIQITVWRLVEASVEIVPQTRAVSDLVSKVRQTTFLTTHQQKFDAFIFGLLNLRLLDFWIGYIRQKEELLAKFYEADAILVHSNSALKKHYDDMVVAIQPLSVLPFQMNPEFIKEKALTDSKLKSQDLIGSKEGITGQSANHSAGNTNSQFESTNESASAEVTSVLELTASKALSWLASATFSSKKKPATESQDLSESRSKSLTFDSSNQMTDSNSTVNQISASFSFHGDEKDLIRPSKSSDGIDKLTELQHKLYCDAKSSRVDCDPIISPTESMRSSQSSLSSLVSNVVSKFDKGGENTSNQSLSQSMTNSANNLVSKIMHFGVSWTPKQKTIYKKGVTEYSFEVSESPQKLESEKTASQQTIVEKKCAEGSSVQPDVEEVKLRQPKTDKTENRNSKRVSFDIVNLFDKLLLPGKAENPKPAKPVSRIPVPTNRWSWSFGPSKPTMASPSKVKSDSEISKREHFPKKNVQNQNEKAKGPAKSPKTDKGPKTVAPAKPPRVVSGTSVGKKETVISKSDSTGNARTVQCNVNNKETATL